MVELSPDLQEIRDAFIANYANGGIEACRTMVDDLKQEAELVDAVADGTSEVDGETIELQTALPPEEVQQRLDLTRGITRDSITAKSRHSFALFLLGIVDTPKE